MKLKIEKTKLSRQNKTMLKGEIGDAAKAFAFFAESTCEFFKDASLNIDIFRGETEIYKDVSAALDVLRKLRGRQDCMHHLRLAYVSIYPNPPLNLCAPNLGFLEGQTAQTRLYKPDLDPPLPDDTPKRYPKPPEITINEMLERVLAALEYAEQHVKDGPFRERGGDPITGDDRQFIRILAAHYESCVGKKAAHNPDMHFHRVLSIITQNAGNLVYSREAMEQALKHRKSHILED